MADLVVRFPRQGEPVAPEHGGAWWECGREETPSLRPDGGDWPPVSVVTPCLDQAAFLPAALASVAAQAYPALEHIVVDGGSVDGTLAILRARGDAVRWTSEPDSGQADAVNKGIARARGEIVGWLNADDFYTPGAVAAAAGFLAAHRDVDVVYGDCLYLYQDAEPEEVRLVRARPFDLDALLNVGCYVPQPATFIRRSALAGVALDTGLRFALDYDLWIRLARAGRTFAYLPRTLAVFRVTPGSKSGARLAEFWREVRAVSRRNGARLLSPMLAGHLKGRAAQRWPRAWAALRRLAGRGGAGR